MKIKPIILCFALLLSSYALFAQKIEIGASYLSSADRFYKNVPGLNFRYTYSFKKQYLFSELNTSEKKNSYTVSGPIGYSAVESYFNRNVNGKLHTNSIRLGVAQILKNTDQVSLSLGGFVSLNYLKFDETIVDYDFINGREVSIWYSSNNEFIKNKPGFGAFLDMEIKQILFHNTSLFSRVGTHYINLGYVENQQIGLGVQINSIMVNLEFVFGIRFNLNKKNL